MRRAIVIGLLAAGSIGAVPLIAQESNEQQKSAFLGFVEDRISAPGRQISINGLEGVLSSDVAIAEITVSDDEGVWLRIENAQLNWNQAALLTGRLQINSLSADSIVYERNAEPPEGVTIEPEAGTLAIPEFPVAINIDELSVPSVSFGEGVFGLQSEISVEGSLLLEGGSLDTSLGISRLDGPGGDLALDVDYDRPSNEIDLGFSLTEPADGLVVNLLNIAGKPAITLNLEGAGPVDALETDLTLDAGATRVLTGTAALSRGTEGLAVEVEANGPIAELFAPLYRPFLGDETGLQANALVRDSGGVRLDQIAVTGGQFRLEGNADTTSDGFLSRLNLEARIADDTGAQVTLPVPGGETSIAQALVRVDYGGGDWQAGIEASGLVAGNIAAEDLALEMTGAATNLEDAATRRITFNADGGVSGLTSGDEKVAEALGDSVAIGVAGLWQAGSPIEIAQARVLGRAFELALSGELDELVFDGDIALATSSIAPFSGVAGRQLQGSATLTASGQLMPVTGGFNLALDGTAEDLALNMNTFDALLEGQTRLGGWIARTSAGLSADEFAIANDQVQITADGRYSSDLADFRFGIGVADLALVSEAAQGPLSVSGTASGSGGPIAVELRAEVPQGQVAGETLRDAALALTGDLNESGFAGEITGDAFIGGHRATLRSALLTGEEGNRLSGLSFSVAGTEITGDVLQAPSGLLEGLLDVDAPDISRAAALMLTEAEGAAEGRVRLSVENGQQAAEVNATLSGIVAAGARVSSAEISARISDLFGVPVVDGTLNGRDISAGGVDIATLAASAAGSGETTDFSAEATLDNNADLTIAGQLSPLAGGYRLAVSEARLTGSGVDAVLAQATELRIAGGSVSISPTRLDVGGGQISLSGTSGETLDLDVAISALPLSVANAIRPDLGLGGSVSGYLLVTGSANAPAIDFEVSGTGIDAATIRPFGVAPLRVDANGSFANGELRLAASDISGAGGLSARASGRMPLIGSGGSLQVSGSVPLTLANRTLGARGAQASGTLSIEASVTGSLAAPSYSGTITTANAEYVDPLANLRLTGIRADARLSGDRVVINSLAANLATGGSVSASGSVALTGGYDAALDISLNNARYADGTLFVATLSGGLRLNGPLLQSPVLSGDIAVQRAEISVPDIAPGGASLIEVDHVAPTPAVRQSLQRAQGEAGNGGGSSSGALRLDIRLSAPNQVFVRGRGLDAELGGAVVLSGPVTAISPVGGFNLIRGRMNILGQRIDFDSGQVTLVGDLDPYLDFSASSPGESVDVFITVRGPASDLDISFSSQPELPQDEVLSQLIFKRALGDLSPLQLARLAAAAGQLVGDGNNDLMSGLRNATGLDDIDIITDAEGNTAVRAGRYIQDNVYVSVEAGAEGESKISLDLDITDEIKARGSTTTEGETSIGVFYETDY